MTVPVTPAADIYWALPAGGFFSTPSNWGGNVVPGSNDVAHFNAYNSSSANYGPNDYYLVTFTQNVTNAYLTCSALGTEVNVYLDGYNWTQTNTVYNPLTVDRNGVGTFLDVYDGTMFTNVPAGYESAIGLSTGGSGRMEIDHTSWINDGTLSVGASGIGTLAVDLSSTLTVNGQLVLGENVGSSGSLGVNGILGANNVETHIGQSGQGGLYIASGGACTFNQNLLFGVNSGSSGTAEVANGTLSCFGGYEFIGYGGVGNLDVDATGTQIVTGTLILGESADATGVEVLGYVPPVVQIRRGEAVPPAPSVAVSTVTGNEIVGVSATGNAYPIGANFSQLSGTDSSVGTNSVGAYLMLAQNAGSTAVYRLSDVNAYGSILTINGALVIGAGGAGTFQQSGGTVTINNVQAAIPGFGYGTGLIVGAPSSTGIGTYQISGGSITAPGGLVGDGGTGTINQIGGSVTINNGIAIGFSSSGTYIQSNGTFKIPSTGTYIDIGDVASGVGVYTLSNQAYASAPELYIGDEGNGYLSVAGSAELTVGQTSQNGNSGNIFIGNTVGSRGMLAQTGGYVLATNAYVGYAGVGTLLISNGTFEAAEAAVGDTGTGTINQSNGTVYIDKSIAIGFANKGTYIQSGGSFILQFNGSYVDIGDVNSGVGIYTISGSASSSTPEIFIGDAGSGQLNVSGGTLIVPKVSGSSNSGNIIIGNIAGSRGVLTQTGGHISATNEYIGYGGIGIANLSGGVTNAATVLVGSNTGGVGTLTVSSTGVLNISAGITVQTGSTFNIATGGLVKLLPQYNVDVVASLTITGKLDLTDNELDLPGANYPQVGVLIKQGNITSSLEGSDTMLGEIQSGSDVLVRLTYFGDVNLDGTVDGSDYSRIDNGYLNHLTGWSNGDLNYDGVIDASDYTLIDNAYNSQGAQLSAQVGSPSGLATSQIASGATAVPEPTAICLWGIAVTVSSLCRRKRRRV